MVLTHAQTQHRLTAQPAEPLTAPLGFVWVHVESFHSFVSTNSTPYTCPIMTSALTRSCSSHCGLWSFRCCRCEPPVLHGEDRVIPAIPRNLLDVCTVAVLVGGMRLGSCAALSMVPGAWSVSCADWRSIVLTVGVPCLLCTLAVPGVWGFLRVTLRNQKFSKSAI